MRHQRRQLRQAFFLRRCGIDLSEFRKQPFGFGLTVDRFVAAMNLHRLRCVNGGQSVGFVQLPAINEAVMT